jgi:mannitol/fructose-specific phosphotransferase system IIA component (Ntr-type)
MALIERLDESVIKIPLVSRSKDDVICELVTLLSQAGRVHDYDEALRAVMDRETRQSTGLEEGIAIPHGKTSAVDDLTITIGISPEGIDFNALDHKPSKIFFLLLAPPGQPGPHIEALAEIARVARVKTFCETMISCKTSEEVLRLLKGE